MDALFVLRWRPANTAMSTATVLETIARNVSIINGPASGLRIALSVCRSSIPLTAFAIQVAHDKG